MKLSAKTDIELGGATRTLVLDMNTMAEIEETLNINLMQDGEEFFLNLSFHKVRVIVWAMLHQMRKRPTIAIVGHWLSSVDMNVVAEKIMKLFSEDVHNEPSEGSSVNPTQG